MRVSHDLPRLICSASTRPLMRSVGPLRLAISLPHQPPLLRLFSLPLTRYALCLLYLHSALRSFLQCISSISIYLPCLTASLPTLHCLPLDSRFLHYCCIRTRLCYRVGYPTARAHRGRGH